MKAFVALALLATAPAVPQDTGTPAAAPTVALTVDTSIEKLVADPKGKAAVEAVFPGITQHPAYDQFKGMSVVQLQPFSQGQVTDEKVAALKAELAK